MRGWGWIASIALLTLALGLAVLLPSAGSEEAEIRGHVLRAPRVPATPERIASLRVPSGFRVAVFAEGLGKPRMLAVAEDGSVYVTRRDPGDLWLLQDTDGDGRAEVKQKLLDKADLHGIALDGSTVYLTTIKEALLVSDDSNGILYRVDTSTTPPAP
jgi:glucose/arabinose dehydrogenase